MTDPVKTDPVKIEMRIMPEIASKHEHPTAVQIANSFMDEARILGRTIHEKFKEDRKWLKIANTAAAVTSGINNGLLFKIIGGTIGLIGGPAGVAIGTAVGAVVGTAVGALTGYLDIKKRSAKLEKIEDKIKPLFERFTDFTEEALDSEKTGKGISKKTAEMWQFVLLMTGVAGSLGATPLSLGNLSALQELGALGALGVASSVIYVGANIFANKKAAAMKKAVAEMAEVVIGVVYTKAVLSLDGMVSKVQDADKEKIENLRDKFAELITKIKERRAEIAILAGEKFGGLGREVHKDKLDKLNSEIRELENGVRRGCCEARSIIKDRTCLQYLHMFEEKYDVERKREADLAATRIAVSGEHRTDIQNAVDKFRKHAQSKARADGSISGFSVFAMVTLTAAIFIPVLPAIIGGVILGAGICAAVIKAKNEEHEKMISKALGKEEKPKKGGFLSSIVDAAGMIIGSLALLASPIAPGNISTAALTVVGGGAALAASKMPSEFDRSYQKLERTIVDAVDDLSMLRKNETIAKLDSEIAGAKNATADTHNLGASKKNNSGDGFPPTRDSLRKSIEMVENKNNRPVVRQADF